MQKTTRNHSPLLSYVCAATLLCMLSCPVRGAILVENEFDPIHHRAHLEAWYSYIADSPDHSSQVADDFTLARSAHVTAFEWYGYWPGGGWLTGDFRISLYANDSTCPALPADEPAAVFDVSHVTGVRTGFRVGDDILRFVAELESPLNLDAATYWLSVQFLSMNSDPQGMPYSWNHGTTAGTMNDATVYYDYAAGVWLFRDDGRRNSQAFTIHGAYVPLPGAGLLFITGLAVLGTRARHARAA